ncbi:MAG: hypothetical protein Ta2A_12760 [Treponemataceae bacterium]|nr:MAG: hypothetical protein Ta2A_12760 [Treponemataceae bacterium]
MTKKNNHSRDGLFFLSSLTEGVPKKYLEILASSTAKDTNLLELTLTAPEADINGLHFTETKVKAVFEQKDDGCYYSRDVLFFSPHRTENGETDDVVTEYLETIEFRTAIFDALPQALKPAAASCIKAFIPEYEDGRNGYEIKCYTGDECWYLLSRHFAFRIENQH